MSRLSSPTRSKSAMAPPLPVANSVFNRNGIAFRRGQFSLLVAGPGTGKSVLARNLAVRTKVRTAFFSADSDEWTTRISVLGVLTGTPLEQIERQLNETAWEEYYRGVLAEADHVDFCYQTDIPAEFIVNRLKAYDEIQGEYPEFIIVDNLGNCVESQENEMTELRSICRELQRVARKTKAHVMALHHVVGAKENGKAPIDLGDLIGKIGKISELVLGLSRTEDDKMLHVTVPKNRLGRGNFAFQLPVDYETAYVGGFHVGR